MSTFIWVIGCCPRRRLGACTWSKVVVVIEIRYGESLVGLSFRTTLLSGELLELRGYGDKRMSGKIPRKMGMGREGEGEGVSSELAGFR